MKLGIIIAMNSEKEQLTKLITDTHIEQYGRINCIVGRVGANTIYIVESGIGKVNAAVSTVELISSVSPDAIISIGVAGGMGAEVRVMDVVVSKELAYHDVWCGSGNEYGQVQGLPLRYQGDANLLSVATSLNSARRIHEGLICTGEKFIPEGAEFNAMKANFPEVLAVDMESAAIAQACYLYSKPFISFRIISDTPGKNAQQQYSQFWATLAPEAFAIVRDYLEAIPANL